MNMKLISKNKTVVAVKVVVEDKSTGGLHSGNSTASRPLFHVVSANEDYPEYNIGTKLLISTSPPKAKFDGTEYYFVNIETILAVYQD